MASVTFDGHSLSIDGKRIWLVSGTIDYARLPRASWAEHLREAKHAGLNCVETPVVWSRHEPRQGKFDWDGDLDLKGFLELVKAFGMHCVLRPGPFVGDGWDLGGIPSWVAGLTREGLRRNDDAYLGAVSKWIRNFAAQIKEHQVAGRKADAGPVIMVQNEHEWFCGDDVVAAGYLAETARFLRENGVGVPLINSNNLFAGVEGEINGWMGYTHLHAHMRQLGTVAPNQPRMMTHLRVGAADVWGEKRRSQKTPRAVVRRLVECLAGGGQYNISPFAGGTNIGWGAGRHSKHKDKFVTQSHDAGAPLGECGVRTPLYNAVRRVNLFANTFGRVLAACEPSFNPTMLATDSSGGEVLDEDTGKTDREPGTTVTAQQSISVAELRGTMGSAVFVLGDRSEKAKGQHTRLILPDGSAIPVWLGDIGISWLLLNTHIAGRVTMDYTNLCPVLVEGKVLVCFGVGGTTGMFSFNGVHMEIDVPTGKDVTVEPLDGVTLVICNESMIDSIVAHDGRVYLGVLGFDADGRPVSAGGSAPTVKKKSSKKKTRSRATTGNMLDVIEQSGGVDRVEGVSRPKTPSAPEFDSWAVASLDDFVDGTSDRYALIDGPATMETLGAGSGYGWIRLNMKSGAAKQVRASMPEAADRIGLYHNGEAKGVFGLGPGAEDKPAPIALKRGDQSIVLLVDNLGRASGGSLIGEPKGVYGHLWESVAFKMGAPKLEHGTPVSPLSVRSPIMGVDAQDRTSAQRVTWSFTHRKKSPIIVQFEDVGVLGVLLINDEPIGVIAPGGWHRFVLDHEKTKRGANVLQVAVLGDAEEALAALKPAATFLEGKSCLTEKATWSFAKWDIPPVTLFEDLDVSELSGKSASARKGKPVWWRATFQFDPEAGAPLLLDASGLSKGQIILNDENVGRYFVATAEGKKVPPQSRYHLPASWLKPGRNTLHLFDEHGFAPSKASLVYDRNGVFA